MFLKASFKLVLKTFGECSDILLSWIPRLGLWTNSLLQEISMVIPQLQMSQFMFAVHLARTSQSNLRLTFSYIYWYITFTAWIIGAANFALSWFWSLGENNGLNYDQNDSVCDIVFNYFIGQWSSARKHWKYALSSVSRCPIPFELFQRSWVCHCLPGAG